MHLSHIQQCAIQNRNVHIYVLNGALWDMEQVHCGICEISQLYHLFMLLVVTFWILVIIHLFDIAIVSLFFPLSFQSCFICPIFSIYSQCTLFFNFFFIYSHHAFNYPCMIPGCASEYKSFRQSHSPLSSGCPWSHQNCQPDRLLYCSTSDKPSSKRKGFEFVRRSISASSTSWGRQRVKGQRSRSGAQYSGWATSFCKTDQQPRSWGSVTKCCGEWEAGWVLYTWLINSLTLNEIAQIWLMWVCKIIYLNKNC